MAEPYTKCSFGAGELLLSHRAAVGRKRMLAKSFVLGLFLFTPLQQGEGMLMLVDSKAQGVHSDMSRKPCVVLLGVLEAARCSAGYNMLLEPCLSAARSLPVGTALQAGPL